MNAHISNLVFQVVNDVAKTVQPVTVEDICEKMPNGYRTISALEHVYDIPRETEINRALRRIDHKIAVQVSHRKAKSWAYESLTLKNLVDLREALGLGLLMRSPR